MFYNVTTPNHHRNADAFYILKSFNSIGGLPDKKAETVRGLMKQKLHCNYSQMQCTYSNVFSGCEFSFWISNP